ncbi:MAG: hypothetical protein Alpg2KO_21190 [Alphaproteobacteria bacterium]
MDRRLLKYLLASGPSRKFDVRAATLGLGDQTAPEAPLFKTDALNHSILIKYREPGNDMEGQTDSLIPTIVYMPYDPEEPTEGGESFIFSPENYTAFMAEKSNHATGDEKPVSHDCDVLEALDDLPTLSPYLIGEEFKRRGLTVDEAYLRVTGSSANSLHDHMCQHLRPLVETAFGAGHARLEDLIDRIAQVVVEGTDLDALRPLGHALKLNDEMMQKCFTSWAGITHFESEFQGVLPGIRNLLTWLGQFYLPKGRLPTEMKLDMLQYADYLRTNMRNDWTAIQGMFSNYSSAYAMLVEDGDAVAFQKILQKAPEYYWRMGDILGRKQQLLGYWEELQHRHGDGFFPYEVLDEFYSITNRAYRSATAETQVMQAA